MLFFAICFKLKLKVRIQVDIIGFLYSEGNTLFYQFFGIVPGNEVRQLALYSRDFLRIIDSEIQPCRHPHPLGFKKRWIVKEGSECLK